MLVVLSACRLFTEPTSSSRASGLDGQWVEQQTFPGNSLAFTLQSSDTTLTGSGESHGEAGPRGTVTVTGSTSGRDVTLHFTFKANLPAPFTNVARFIGGLDGDRLTGSMKHGPESGDQPESPQVFLRIIPR